MAAAGVITDETMRSRVEYGENNFPFACVVDELGPYESQSIQWHWHNEFEFSLVVRGSIICRAGTDSFELGEGGGVFINSGAIHRFEARQPGQVVNFIFSPEFIAAKESLIYMKYVQPVLAADLEYARFDGGDEGGSGICMALRELRQLCAGGDFGRELAIHSCLTGLWKAFAARSFDSLQEKKLCGSRASQARLQKMMSYIHSCYRQPLTLEDIAASASVSKSEALRCFHTGIETTPVKYLNEYRINRAKERLLGTSDSVTAVAEAAGFESTGYFCQVFRARCGCSPNEFRRKMR